MKYFVTGFALLLLLTSCSTQRVISRYGGDGEIFAMPDGGFWQGGGGYRVYFERMRLDQPAQMTYRFTGLPKIDRQVEVYYVIEGPLELDRRNDGTQSKPAFIDDLRGKLALTLRDADGNMILECRRKLSEFVWSESGGSASQWLYDEEHNGFSANPSKKYVLEVSIEPDEALKDYNGYVLFTSGGHEGISVGF